MEIITQVDGCQYVYRENFWTGKKELFINGIPMQKTGKKTFLYVAQDGSSVPVSVKGSFLTGVSLLINGQELVLCKNKWYEWILIFMPLIGLALGIFCGALGAAICALCTMGGAIINAQILRSKTPLPLKILGCICIFVVMNLAWFFIYAMIVGGLATAFPGIFE